ncbi:MAG: lycopene cyclase domain-containing protein [Mycobacteriales bacterium]
MTYTTAAVLAVVGTMTLDVAVLRTRILAQQAFWIAYAIILGFQLVTNGILAGQGVVRYDGQAILGARFVWAPVEDLLFGFALVVQTLSWWTFWGSYGLRSAATRRTRPTATRRSSTR